jgi:uncharacterized protein (TIGR03067 family)
MVEPVNNTRLDTREADLAALQGSWEQVYMEADGVSEPPDDYTAPGVLTTISANQFTVHTVDGAVLLEGRFILDATTEPRSITWIDTIGPDAGKQLPASYILQGDSFVFIAADMGAPRPTNFRTTQGLVMRSFIRRRRAS